MSDAAAPRCSRPSALRERRNSVDQFLLQSQEIVCRLDHDARKADYLNAFSFQRDEQGQTCAAGPPQWRSASAAELYYANCSPEACRVSAPWQSQATVIYDPRCIGTEFASRRDMSIEGGSSNTQLSA